MPSLSILSFLLNPKFLIAAAIVALVGFGYYKYHSLESSLAETQHSLQVEQDNNKILRTNLETATAVNEENKKTIEQVTADKVAAIKTITALNGGINRTNQSLTALQAKIDELKNPPEPIAKLSPYIVQAIVGIQGERDKYYAGLKLSTQLGSVK